MVLSTIKGRPTLSQIAAIATKSVMYPPGLAIDSQKMARVSSSTAVFMNKVTIIYARGIILVLTFVKSDAI